MKASPHINMLPFAWASTSPFAICAANTKGTTAPESPAW